MDLSVVVGGPARHMGQGAIYVYDDTSRQIGVNGRRYILCDVPFFLNKGIEHRLYRVFWYRILPFRVTEDTRSQRDVEEALDFKVDLKALCHFSKVRLVFWR